MTGRSHVFSHTPESLREWCAAAGLEAYRAKQVLEWVYRKGVIDPAAMSDLPTRMRERLAEGMAFYSGETVAEQVATDGTRKLLIEWGDADGESDAATEPRSHEGGADGERSRVSLSLLNAGAKTAPKRTECVMIPSLDVNERGQPTRRTACISSQVGCPVGCRFCASGLDGLAGNLSSGRIVEQVWRLERAVRESAAAAERDRVTRQSARRAAPPGSAAAKAHDPAAGARISNVVFMGMGEPLANMKNVVAAVRTLAAPWGMGISARKITISTVGMHRAIEKLADELDLPVTLALSLHAPNDGLRRELIPWAEFTTIEQLFAACAKWFEKTGREITLEYTLLGDVNDRPEHAEELASIARTLRANVNLIRYNEVAGMPFARPTAGRVHAFQNTLREAGVNTHIRASRGRDIAAACGQLRRERAGAGGSGAGGSGAKPGGAA